MTKMGLPKPYRTYSYSSYWPACELVLCSFYSLINQLIDCSTHCLQNLGKCFLRYISHINTRELVILDSVDTKSIQSRCPCSRPISRRIAIKAVVVNPESTGVAVEEKVLRPLETGEALAEIEYCCVCHTDNLIKTYFKSWNALPTFLY